MKKTLAMLVAVFALSVTVGCSGSSSTPPAAPKPPATSTPSTPDKTK